METQDEIGTPTTSGGPPRTPFGKRLRLALEGLEVGQDITIRTKTERQHVTNIVSNVQKKMNVKFVTNQLVRRVNDPEGKIVIRIIRVEKDVAP